MLRIGLPGAPPSAPPDMPPMPPPDMDSPDSEPDGDESGSRFSIDKVNPQSAGYMGADQGPFKCGNCEYFSAPSSCKIVSGPIEAEGCCNLFQKSDGDEADMTDPSAQGAPQSAGPDDANQEMTDL